MTENPFISIITVNLNELEGLKRTVKSVFEQTWQDFEFIVIDGGSVDGSEDFIKINQEKINFWVSEPDSGIYNAMNKGIKEATGKYLYFLNSGDCLNNKEVLFQASKQLIDNYDIYYGDVQLTGSDIKKEVLRYPKKLKFSFFYHATIIHQAAFIKRTLFDQIFYYNEELKLVSDWEFFICAICKFNASYNQLKFTVTSFDMNGISSNPINEKLLYDERAICLKKHFPLFIDDYEEFFHLRAKMNLPSVKTTLELRNYITARKINEKVSKILLKVSQYKNRKL